MDKTEVRLEVAYEILSMVHTEMCLDKKFDQAEELREIMRRLILLSQKCPKTP